MFVSRGDNGDAHDNNADHHRDPAAARRAREAARLPDATRTGASTTTWRRRRSGDGADDEGLEGGGRARRAKKSPTCRRSPTPRRRGIKIAPWDYRYYAEKVRKAKYDLDQNEVKPYLQLDKLREGDVLGGGPALRLRRSRRSRTCRSITPTSRVWEVTRGGKHVGLWYFDPYARAGKRSGAWMNEYRTQETLQGRRHADRLEQRELREGQARRAGPDLAGTTRARCSTSSATRCTASTRTSPTRRSPARTSLRDFVEFPSQLNEHWLPTPEVLEQVRAPLPDGQADPAPSWSRRSRRRSTSTRASTPSSTWRRRSYDMKLHLRRPTADRSRRVRARRRWRRSACRRRS